MLFNTMRNCIWVGNIYIWILLHSPHYIQGARCCNCKIIVVLSIFFMFFCWIMFSYEMWSHSFKLHLFLWIEAIEIPKWNKEKEIKKHIVNMYCIVIFFIFLSNNMSTCNQLKSITNKNFKHWSVISQICSYVSPSAWQEPILPCQLCQHWCCPNSQLDNNNLQQSKASHGKWEQLGMTK